MEHRGVHTLLLTCVLAGCTGGEERGSEVSLTASERFESRYALIPAGAVTREWGPVGDWQWRGVRIKEPFYLKRHEVTVREWIMLMGENPSQFVGCGLDCPITNVSWFDGIDYMNKLSLQEGLTPCYEDAPCEELRGPGCEPSPRRVRWRLSCDGYRYPTEPEWMWASQGGVDSYQDSYIGPLTVLGEHHSPELDTIAVYGGNSGAHYDGAMPCDHIPERQYIADRCGPAPVGSKRPNAYGLYDMIGNVEEWTWGHNVWRESNIIHHDIFSAEDGGSLTTLFSSGRAFRGCSWRSSVAQCRLESRSGISPDMKSPLQGFRPARNYKR